MFKAGLWSVGALAVLAILATGGRADDAQTEGPVYQRYRQNDAYGAAQGPYGSYQQPPYQGYHYGGYYPAFYPPFYYPQWFAGSWYQRPYPYHLDYYKWRYAPGNSVPPASPGKRPAR